VVGNRGSNFVILHLEHFVDDVFLLSPPIILLDSFATYSWPLPLTPCPSLSVYLNFATRHSASASFHRRAQGRDRDRDSSLALQREQAQLARLAAQYERELTAARRAAASAQSDIEAARVQSEQQHAAAMAQIEEKVRAVTARKDEQITALRETLRIKELRAQQIEALLERQRHELGGM
jgi:hypothetical protein